VRRYRDELLEVVILDVHVLDRVEHGHAVLESLVHFGQRLAHALPRIRSTQILGDVDANRADALDQRQQYRHHLVLALCCAHEQDVLSASSITERAPLFNSTLTGRAGLGREHGVGGIGGRAFEEHIDDVVTSAAHASIVLTCLFLLVRRTMNSERTSDHGHEMWEMRVPGS
jgi:hypothetical protein